VTLTRIHADFRESKIFHHRGHRDHREKQTED
jgi:hypothetical protein